jgi:nucleoside-diphosphate-sugar epimerase
MPPQQTPPCHLLIGFEHPFAIELSRALQTRYGPDQVEGTNDLDNLATFIGRWRPTDVYLLSSLFPPTDAEHPATHWHRSTRQLLKVLNLARHYPFKLFYPSSIAVFGTTAPTTNCPDDAPQDPQNYFGLSKRAAERWCEHYFLEYEIDVRSLRFPAIIRPSNKTATHKKERLSIKEKPLPSSPQTTMPLKPAIAAAAVQTRPVLHMNDAVRATIELMAAPFASIRNRRSYNLASASVSLTDLAEELSREKGNPGIDHWNLPENSGPTSVDDTNARTDWGWKPAYDLVQLIGSFLPSR